VIRAEAEAEAAAAVAAADGQQQHQQPEADRVSPERVSLFTRPESLT
jgi:hypothetical protein